MILRDGFCLNWPIKMLAVREAELTIVVEQTRNLTTPPRTVLALLLASSNESHYTVVKKMSKSCQKLIKNFIKWQQYGAQHSNPCQSLQNSFFSNSTYLINLHAACKSACCLNSLVHVMYFRESDNMCHSPCRYLADLMDNPVLIRNVALAGHLHTGKVILHTCTFTCICCNSILSLVKILFSSTHYHTLPYPKTNENKI